MNEIKKAITEFMSNWRYCEVCEVAVKGLVKCNCYHYKSLKINDLGN